MSIYCDISDSDILDIYKEAVNFRPARKTTQRVGDRDGRIIAVCREAECGNWSQDWDYSLPDGVSELLESYGLPLDLEPEDEPI